MPATRRKALPEPGSPDRKAITYRSPVGINLVVPHQLIKTWIPHGNQIGLVELFGAGPPTPPAGFDKDQLLASGGWD